MSAPAFSPGPWEAREFSMPDGALLTRPGCVQSSLQITPLADARLIAASPDLYAALRDATDALDYVHAIDSVTPPECDPDDGLCGAQFCAQNGCVVRKIAVARAALAKAQGTQS